MKEETTQQTNSCFNAKNDKYTEAIRGKRNKTQTRKQGKETQKEKKEAQPGRETIVSLGEGRHKAWRRGHI